MKNHQISSGAFTILSDFANPKNQFVFLDGAPHQRTCGGASLHSDLVWITWRSDSEKSATELELRPFWSPKVRKGLALEQFFFRGQGCRGLRCPMENVQTVSTSPQRGLYSCPRNLRGSPGAEDLRRHRPTPRGARPDL